MKNESIQPIEQRLTIINTTKMKFPNLIIIGHYDKDEIIYIIQKFILKPNYEC